MANQLEKGHQAALVTLKGMSRRVHVMASHHSGDTVSSVCLREMVEGTEARLGCRPRRRTERLGQRIENIEAKVAQRRDWYDKQRAVIRQQIERQVRLGDQLRVLRPQLEADNATHPNPVQIRWLLDGGFGDAANVMHLIEMRYDLYAIAHNGKTTQALLKQVPETAQWTQAGVRTQALDMGYHQLGDCPYPVRLTLLRWQLGDTFKHSTLISFSDVDELPTPDLFPTYHERQDVEAGIKQGKGTFSFTKLRVRSPAGIRLLGQFALVFWPNFALGC
jgi:hypothetical protein